jgi:serine/threonine protein kinase/Tfp pilus assembly protein PilF
MMTTQCPKCQAENPDTKQFCGDCGTQLTPAQEGPIPTQTLEVPREELTTGSTFAGRYQIIEELGQGGMGRVYKAADTKINEKVALKLIKPEIAKDKKTIERFSNELRLARKIRHKNVCGMFDLGEEKGTHFITMEFVSGEDLRSSIRRFGQLPIGKSISISKQICEGLVEAHRLGIVHRDLKSNNIMIDKEGNVRIMDFGIARSLESKGITGAGVMIGTPEYMSPEQVEGKEVDQRSDIYSLGVILYEMVTGRVPFEGDTPFTIGMKHKGEIPQNPKELNTQISDDLCSVILKCLEKDKDQRYQSAGEVSSELANIEKGIPTTEIIIPTKKPFTSKEITVQFSVKKLFIPALIMVAVVVIGFILWKFLPKEKAAPAFSSDKPSVAVVYFINRTGDEALDNWREAFPQWIITDLSQSKYINVLPADRLFSIHRNLNLMEAKSYATEDLRNIAREGRVSHIFQASFSKAGDIFRIDYTLQKGDTLEIIALDYVTGRSEESFPSLVDDITRKIKTNLELSDEQVESDIDKNANTITSNSPEAFKYYSIGRKFLSQGEYRKAVELFEQAVAIDEEFGEAYYYMGASYYNLNYRIKAKELFQKALEFKDKLSDRTRYRIEAVLFLLSEATWDKSIEAYKRMLEIYPDSVGSRNNLAVLYLNLEEYQKAIDHFEICITKYGYEFIAAYTSLASCYRNLGLYDKAKEAVEKWLNNFPDIASVHRSLATTYRYQMKFDLALDEMDKAFILAPTAWLNLRTKGDVYYYMGDWTKAEGEYRKLLEKEEPTAKRWGLQRLRWLFSSQGRLKDSIEMTNRGIELGEELGETIWIRDATDGFAYLEMRSGNHERALELREKEWKSAVEDEHLGDRIRSLYWKAAIYVEMKRLEEAQKAAQELKVLIEQGMNKNRMRRYYSIMGIIEIERKDYSKAIEYFKQGLPLLRPQSWMQMIYANFLGLAYYKSGDLEKAREEYEKIDFIKGGGMRIGDIYAKSFYMLGKIYEEQGDTAIAIEHYEKFLSLWKDADPGKAEVDDARERLAGLKTKNP